jgi:hypothetical protein
LTEQYKAKPTLFNGTTYRSKAEARLAVCFDAWCWNYKYENVSVGNWKPDFTIQDGSFVRIIEYKPCNPTLEYLEDLARNFKTLLRALRVHPEINARCDLWCIDFWNDKRSGFEFFENGKKESIDHELTLYDFSPGMDFRFDLRSSSQDYDYAYDVTEILERMRRNDNTR